MSNVKLKVRDRVASILLDRSEFGNRLNRSMMLELQAALIKANTSDADILILQAAGPDFCLGRDYTERDAAVSFEEAVALAVDVNRLLSAFSGVSVAKHQGRAIGFGCGLVVLADITVSTLDSQMAFDEVARGSTPTIVMSYLQDYISRKAATDLILTGRTLLAREAVRLGLVTRAVEWSSLETTISDCVDNLLAKDPGTLRRSKSYLREIGTVAAADRFAYGERQAVLMNPRAMESSSEPT